MNFIHTLVANTLGPLQALWSRLTTRPVSNRRKAAIKCTKKGAELFNAHRYELAEAQFQKALKYDPSYARAHTYLGNTFYKQGRLTQATHQWRQAVAAEPGSDAAKAAEEKLGRVEHSSGDKVMELWDRMKR